MKILSWLSFSSFSVSTKLFLLTGTLILLALITINVLNYQYTKQEVEHRILYTELPTLSNEIVALVQKELEPPIALASLTANNGFLVAWLKNGEKTKTEINQYFKYLKTNKPISVVNMVSDRSLRFYNDNEKTNKIINPEKDKWYANFKAKNIDKEFNINRNAKGKLTFFINCKIKDSTNNFLGLAGIGLDLDELSALILSKKVGRQGNIMMIDKEGFIKIHQNINLVDKNNEKIPAKNIKYQRAFASIANNLLAGKGGTYRYQNGKDNVVLKAVFIPEFQWFLIIEISETEILAPIYAIFLWNMLIGFCITLVIIAVGIIMIRGLVFYPLKNLSQGIFSFFDFLNRKSSTSTLIKINTQDEFGELSDIINQNIQTIQQGIHQDNLLIKETTTLVDTISEGFLDTRLNLEGNNPELKNLKIEINEMLDRLEEKVGSNINHIIQTMQHYASMRFDTKIEAPKGEIEKNVNQMGQAIHEKQQEILQQRDSIAQKNAQINNSIQAARTIQQAILPYKEKLDRLLKHYFILNKPKDVVSGDFYWLTSFQKQETSEMILVVADCTGHGVEGAFMTLIGNTLLDKIVRVRGVLSPADILTQLHEEIHTMLRQGETLNKSGMDSVVIKITRHQSLDTVQITFAGAKNELCYIKPNDEELYKLKGDRKSIGGEQNPNKSFHNQTIDLPAKTLIYVGTDGITDQNNVRRKKLGADNLNAILLQHKHLSLPEQKIALEKVLETYMENTTQRDDILFLGFEI